jgi:hypothetical protein
MESRQTMFTLELLDKYAVGRLGSPTKRSSLICGLAGGLVLSAAGLTAYGWRGGLAGAAIGMTMGLPHSERIDTFDVSYNRRTRDQLREVWNPEDRIDRIADWVFTFQLVVSNSRFYLGALPITASAAATVGILLGSPDGLVSGLTYGVATAVAVLTAVILCSGCSHVIQDMQAVAPHERSGEVPSPIARAVARGGLLATPVVALATPILPGLLVALLITSTDGVKLAAVVAVGAAMLTLIRLGGFAVVEQAMVRLTLRKRDLAPLPLRPFLDYATQCLFLRQVGDSYLFVHLSLLEFFAEMWDFDDVPAERLDEITAIANPGQSAPKNLVSQECGGQQSEDNY